MLPEIIGIDTGFGRLAINGYGLMIGIGAIIAYSLLAHESVRRGYDKLHEHLPSLFFWGAGMAFVGGKVFFMIFHKDAFVRDIETHGFLKSLGQGFVFYGSLLTALPVILWRLKKIGIPLLKGMDVLIIGAPVIHGFGRLGCFCAGCCHGSRYDGSLAVEFTIGNGLNGVHLHPVQLYEAGGELIIFALLWFVVRKNARFAGQMVLTYLIAYAILRFGTEFVRGDGNPTIFEDAGHVHRAGDAPNGLTVGQVTSILTVIPCAFLLYRGFQRHPSRPRI